MRSTLLIIMLDFFVSSLMLFISVDGGDGNQEYFGNGKPLAEIHQQAQYINEINDLQNDVDEYFKKIYDEQNALNESYLLQKKSIQLENENKKLVTDNKILSRDTALYSDSLETKSQINISLAIENSELRDKNIQLEEQIRVSKNDIADLEDQRNKAEIERSSLKDDNISLSANLQAREEQLAVANREKNDLQEHTNKIATANAQLEQQYKEALDAKDEAQSQFQAEQNRRLTFETENSHLKQKLDEKNAELSQLRAESDKKLIDLQNQVKTLQAGQSEVRQMGQALMQGQQDAKNRQKEMQAGLARVEGNVDETRKGVGRVESNTEDIKRDTGDIKATLAEIQQKLDRQSQQMEEDYKKWQQDSQEFLAQMADQNKKEEQRLLEELNAQVESAKQKLDESVRALETAVASGDAQRTNEAYNQYDQARESYSGAQAAASSYGNDHSVPASAVNLAEARVELKFSLSDNDFFKDHENFSTYGMAVSDSDGKKWVLAHQKQLGLSWNQFSDGLSKANLIARASMASNSVYNFSSLSGNRSIIKMSVSNISASVPIYDSIADIPRYTPGWTKNLTSYSADRKHAPKAITVEVDVQSNQLKFGGIRNSFERYNVFRDFSTGDFVLDDTNHLVCIMTSSNECRYVTRQDLNYTSDDFSLYPLDSFAKDVVAYQRQVN